MDIEVIRVRNVAEALPKGLRYLAQHGVAQDSRNGMALVAPGPVVTVYEEPWDCVLLAPLRDANPFFHLAEVIWMMAGRSDAAFLTPYVKDFDRFAEDDGEIHGAYGKRWREGFGFDQLEFIVEKLRDNPVTRQAVLQMWDATSFPNELIGYDDLQGSFNDRPCNTHVYFRARKGALDMTVCCRSNDMIMGAYGANAVHFAFLHEYVSAAAGLSQGHYAQMSNDFHAYERDLQKLTERRLKATGFYTEMDIRNPSSVHNVLTHLAHGMERPTIPRTGGISPTVIKHPDTWLKECEALCAWVEGKLHAENPKFPSTLYESNPFLANTVALALSAHSCYRAGLVATGLGMADQISDPAWRAACTEWLQRRTK